MTAITRRSGDGAGGWVLQWRSPSMAAPAFEYFGSEVEAKYHAIMFFDGDVNSAAIFNRIMGGQA